MRTRKHLILVALLFLLVASLVFVGGGCGSTNSVPTTSTLSPASKTAGEADFTLTVNGTNFVNGSVVKWNGTDRTTTFVSATQLTAAISKVDIATAGTVPVTVFNPKPGGGTSTPALSFTTNSPVPTTSTLSPTSKTVGETDFTLTVNGTNFAKESVVKWNGTDRTTTFVSATQLTAAISAADIAAAGTVPVTVFNPKPGGGTSTPALSFTTNSPATPPPPDPTPKATVYITKTGEKYHSDGCQYLRQSRIPISLSDAIAQGYSP